MIEQSKLPGSGTTIFTVMSKMAQDHGAINLSQGYPDFDAPQGLIELVARHMKQGHNQYSPLAGVPELLEQISTKVADLYAHTADPLYQIAVTPGATEAIFCAITATVMPGDEVIMFDPAYDTYEPSVRLNGGIARRIPMTYPDFRPNWDRVQDAISHRTRLILLNTPHNPSGSVWNEQDIESLRMIIGDSRIILIADEVYEHISFDGREHLSLLRYPDLAARAFCISSFGKTYHVTGWRIGYCVAPQKLMSEFLRIHQFINFSTNAPLQYAIADFLRDCPQYHLGLGRFYQRKRDLLCGLLKGSRFRLVPSAGTYFQLADYSEISNESDTEFARRLTTEHKVAVIPVSVFYDDPPDQNLIRFCFAKNDKTLERAAQRLSVL